MNVPDVPSNVVFSMAHNFLAQKAFKLHIFVYFLVPLEDPLVGELLKADVALDQALVLVVNRLVDLQRRQPLEFLLADRALVFVLVCVSQMSHLVSFSVVFCPKNAFIRK